MPAAPSSYGYYTSLDNEGVSSSLSSNLRNKYEFKGVMTSGLVFLLLMSSLVATVAMFRSTQIGGLFAQQNVLNSPISLCRNFGANGLGVLSDRRGVQTHPRTILRRMNILKPNGKLLIPGKDGVDETGGTFTPYMRPLTRDETTKYGSNQQMLQTLRFQAAPWFERAEMVDILLRAGVPPETIMEDGGVSSMEQGEWRVAFEVLNSLEKLGAEPELLKYFKGDEVGAEVLFGLRYTPKDIRLAAANYCSEKNLDKGGAELLSRNIVAYSRINRLKPEATTGFEYTPADAAALRLYMQAAEVNEDSKAAAYIQEAKDSGCSATAMEKFNELEKMEFAERRKIIFKFKQDTEEYDRALTVDI
eukprot:CAMPEP_0184495098 /NCGR_PEP_ID=MMETSP0113_2-20130426/30377_1 /TAXON_ID=91329 /ORGANISM="Norrisiella sphaerica, Strain BC52" /LENGTH=360 /DNA_ID=CAMNT_0026881137 /DNA_START=45 /DNA_END=1127 /DNA_ORIENTATION=-